MGRHSRDDDDEPTSADPTSDDETAQRDAPAGGLSPGDELFQNLIEVSPDAIFVIVDGYHAFANKPGLALFGASGLKDLRTKPAIEFMDPAIKEAAVERLTTMIDRRQPVEYVDERVVRLDGSLVDVEAAGRPIVFRGRPAALAVLRDTTSRRRAEAQLRSAEEKFRAAFEKAPTGMAIVDRAGMFLDVNAALARLLNRQPQRLFGDLLWHYIDRDDVGRVQDAFGQVIEDPDEDWADTVRYKTGAGSDGWVHASVSALKGTKSFVVHMVDVTQQKETEEHLARKATHDLLTGLPNRELVLQRLSAALRSLRVERGQVHVLFVDLDGFKMVNDRYGHAVGDRVLRAAADRMRAALRPSDTIGRIGGDEFVVIIKSLPHEAPVEEIAHRLSTAVASPVALDEGMVQVEASIGCASTDDPDYPAGRLLGSADAEMYRAKQATQRAENAARLTNPHGLRVVN